MRLGVLDVGSNTVHLLVVDAHQERGPCPRSPTRPISGSPPTWTTPTACPAEGGEALLRDFVDEALQIAEDKGVEDLVAFATSAVRDAANGEDVLARIRADKSIDVRAMSGDEEARLTFLAVRRWFGWSSGRLLVVDIGGGSLEIASGIDEEPDVAISLPLGVARLTRDRFTADPPPPEEIRDLRRRPGGDRPAGRGRRPVRGRRPRGRHVQDVPAARPDRGRGAQRRGALPAPRPVRRRRDRLGGEARADAVRGAPGCPACRRAAPSCCSRARSSRTP